MKQTLFAMAMLPMLAAVANAKPIDWQAELDRCRTIREQMEPLLLAGQGLSPIARSGGGGSPLRLDRTAGAETWRTLARVRIDADRGVVPKVP